MAEAAESQQLSCGRAGCARRFACVDELRRHLATHDAEDGSLVCSLCAKHFRTKNEILRHLRAHASARGESSINRDKNFECETCKKKFFTRKDVKRHLVVHTGTRNFCCSHCPQRFGRKDHLVRHCKKSHPALPSRTLTPESAPVASTSNLNKNSVLTLCAAPSAELAGQSGSAHYRLNAASESHRSSKRLTSSSDLLDITVPDVAVNFKPPVELPDLSSILRPDGSSSSSSASSGVTSACYRQDPSPSSECDFATSAGAGSSTSAQFRVVPESFRPRSDLQLLSSTGSDSTAAEDSQVLCRSDSFAHSGQDEPHS